MVFVLITALIYFLFPVKKYKWSILLVASYVFYFFAGYKYAVFIILTTVTTYLCALLTERISLKSKAFITENRQTLSRDERKALKEKAKKKKRLVIAAVLVLNFGILFFLKYYGFISQSVNGIFRSAPLPSLKLILPLGISFYTFQSMGYIVDVYRENVRAEKNPLKLALFVSFFPQIVQGPIGIYSSLAQQLYEPHGFDFTRAKHACELILWGLFKKLVIADRAVIAINAVTENYASYSGGTLLFTVVLYSLQLYADFSGGIDISRGVAELFGIELMENFRHPYFSKDLNEYWRRWHISLGNWFKNYLFYPLALSKQFNAVSKAIRKTRFGATKAGAHIAKVLPTSIASFIVFFMVGVWHGANWKYVAFGVYNGLIIMLSVLLKPVFESVIKKLKINAESKGYTIFRIVRTYILVLIGYVFDIAPSFSLAMKSFSLYVKDFSIMKSAAEISELGVGKKEYLLLIFCAFIIFLVSRFEELHPNTSLRTELDKKKFIVRFAVLFVLIMSITVCGIYGSGYNPADFVYMQF